MRYFARYDDDTGFIPAEDLESLTVNVFMGFGLSLLSFADVELK